MYCTSCGKQIEEMTKTCPFCGGANRRSDKYYDNLSKLVVAFQKGDTSAFDELYLQMNQYVRMQAMSVVQNEALAEDVVQDVFLSVYNNIGSLENPMTFQAWLKRITYNRAVNAVNKESKYVQVQGASYDEEEGDDQADFFDTQESTDTVLIPESSLESAEMSELFASFMSELPYKQRLVLEGVYFEGKKLKEISEETGINENTLRTSMRRGKESLQKKITAWSEKTGQKLYSIPVGVLFYMLFRKALQGTAVTTAVPASLAAAVSEAAAHAATGALSGTAAEASEAAAHAATGALTGTSAQEASAHSPAGALTGAAGGSTQQTVENAANLTQQYAAATAAKTAKRAAKGALAAKIIAGVAAAAVVGVGGAATYNAVTGDNIISDSNLISGIVSGIGGETKEEEHVYTDEELITDVVETFIEACSDYDEDAMLDCITEENVELYHDIGSWVMFITYFAYGDDWQEYEITDIEVDGDSATCTVVYEGDVLGDWDMVYEMLKEDGEWKIDNP